MLKKIGLLALCGVSAFAMHSVELNINDKDLEFGVKVDMGQFNEATDPDTVFLGAKLLHGSKDHSDAKSSSDLNDYYEVNFLMQRKVKSTDLVIGLGVKLNGTKNYNTFPLGAEASYKLPFGDTMPLFVNGSIYFAPEVLSMQDAKNFLEYRVGLDLEVIKNGSVTLGYRSLDTNYISGKGYSDDFNYNKSVYIGFKFAF
ncbi:YfaZ family outer membrane protein [Sulfurimonas sp.]|uniref:YfaZ family outer membrane protein n=1 Tax=Sulfurimonas sp. TaxID=2022749 RepID=UPI002AB221F0|nr:YfaZ family outer membrane protein [Sulfurimonas sp.]